VEAPDFQSLAGTIRHRSNDIRAPPWPLHSVGRALLAAAVFANLANAKVTVRFANFRSPGNCDNSGERSSGVARPGGANFTTMVGRRRLGKA